MDRVIVIGRPGSASSSFARTLGRITRLPVMTADTTPTTDRWIIGGDAGDLLEARLPVCDTVILLDPPAAACVRRALAAHPAPQHSADTHPAIHLRRALTYRWTERPRTLARIAHLAPDANLVHLTSRGRARRWLERLAGLPRP
ncbi:hypothetical protein ACFCYF_38640 [Streptomyces chartreusis]|uniref:hypothetical protein n=1 Tax=Streptomyces chartreusis TaxID=1969 RepID=UPI0035DD953D